MEKKIKFNKLPITVSLGKFLKKTNPYLKKVIDMGPVRESNPGPLAPKARIMPLDQQARHI